MAARRGARARRGGGGGERDAPTLVVHGPEFHDGELLVLNPETFPHVQLNDLMEISQVDKDHPRLVLPVRSLTPVRGKLQVSVARDIAAQFGLEAFRPVTVQKVDPQDFTVDFIELSFKDQFLSRADIWRFKVTMLGQCVYVGKTVECLGIRSQVDALLAANIPMNCGVIGESTKIVVRSRSSRLFWLVQMSAEMWEFAPDGELYYEKLLNWLLRTLIAKWIDCSVSHSVTIIAFSRSFYDANQFPKDFDPKRAPFVEPRRQGFGPGCTAPGVNMASGYGPTIHVDPLSGRYYEDFYKVLVLNYTGPDWSHLLSLLKKEFASYPETHRWRTPDEFVPAEYKLCHCPKEAQAVAQSDFTEMNSVERSEQAAQTNPVSSEYEQTYVQWMKLPFGVPSRAMNGNILEAINVTLNVVEKHYMDRDLSRTGQSIVMMTAGCSIFNVRSKLAQITAQRMMDNGVGMDMISLSAPPLHVVPLFIYSNQPVSGASESTQVFSESLPYGVNSVQHQVSLEEFSSLNSGGGAKSLDATTAHSGAGFTHTSLPDQRLNPEWDQNPSSLNDRANKVSYDIPHWVNITFLDFDCTCGRGSTRSGNLRAPPSRTPKSSNSRDRDFQQLKPRGWNSCECQTRRNHQFLPLPPFRMFDISAPTEKLEFPVTLRNLMKNRAVNSSNIEPLPDVGENPGDGISDGVCFRGDGDSDSSDLASPNGVTRNHNQVSSETSQLFAPGLSVSPPSPLQISRSPDFDFNPKLTIMRSSSNLTASLYARAALKEYDESVFAPVVREQSNDTTVAPTSAPRASRSPVEKRSGFSSLECHYEHDATSATISGYGDWSARIGKWNGNYAGRGGGDNSSSNSRHTFRKEALFSTGESTSTARSMLSPRAAKRVGNLSSHPQQQLSHSDQTQLKDGSTVGISITPRAATPGEDLFVPSSLEVMLSSSIETEAPRRYLGFPIKSAGVSPAQSMYGTPGKSVGPGFQPLRRSVTQCKEVSPADRGESVSSRPGVGQRQLMNRNSSSAFRRDPAELLTSSLLPEGQSFKPSLGTEVIVPPDDSRKASMNPFRYSEDSWETTSEDFLSDRQRWSHLFPNANPTSSTLRPDDVDAPVTGEPVFLGPNWTSLTSPAVLPLTTDYFPSPKDLRQSYTEAFYMLTLPTTTAHEAVVECVPRYRSHDNLLIEMICQRLACDFQLVSSCGSTASLTGNEASAAYRRRAYHLSMGHRIHQLIHDAERQTIEVKKFVQREPRDPEAAHATYNFSLWVGLTQSFQPHQQLFHRYPHPEDNWNALDNLLCGYLDDMADSTKCRRIRFTIVPPVFRGPQHTAGELDAETPSLYAAKFTKFMDFLQSRVAPSEYGDTENIAINLVLDPAAALPTSREVPPPNGYRMTSVKVGCKVSTSAMSTPSSPLKGEESRTEWVVVRLEDTMDVSRCFHLDVRWLACSGSAADEFVSTIRRRAKQAGLDLRRVPEYSSVSRVQLHPLVASVFLPLPVNLMKSVDDKLPPFIATLTEDLAFVLDDERIADGSGIGYGLGIDQEARDDKPRATVRGHRRTPSATARLLQERWQRRGYKQFIHRRLPVFVRLIHDGLIWIPGNDYENRGDLISGAAAVQELFQDICAIIEYQCSLGEAL